MLEVGPRRARQLALLRAVRPDQSQRPARPALRILLLAVRQAQIGDPRPIRRDVRAAVPATALVGRQLPRLRPLEIPDPESPGAGPIRLPDQEAGGECTHGSGLERLARRRTCHCTRCLAPIPRPISGTSVVSGLGAGRQPNDEQQAEQKPSPHPVQSSEASARTGVDVDRSHLREQGARLEPVCCVQARSRSPPKALPIDLGTFEALQRGASEHGATPPRAALLPAPARQRPPTPPRLEQPSNLPPYARVT